MAVIDSFKANTTSVDFSWPADLSGLERIMLSAHGDLQRLLSAFFSHSINIKTIFAHTSPRTHEASPEQPVTQRREVHLLCNGKTACIATSTVTITTPHVERLFLDEKFAIGQMFRKMQAPPQFALLECGSKVEAGKRVLWRRYTLSTEGFLCDIVEVFPDRDMFVQGEKWLNDEPVSSQESNLEESKRRYATSTVLLTV
jgi:chorismate-pyruvate lyase